MSVKQPLCERDHHFRHITESGKSGKKGTELYLKAKEAFEKAIELAYDENISAEIERDVPRFFSVFQKDIVNGKNGSSIRKDRGLLGTLYRKRGAFNLFVSCLHNPDSFKNSFGKIDFLNGDKDVTDRKEKTGKFVQRKHNVDTKKKGRIHQDNLPGFISEGIRVRLEEEAKELAGLLKITKIKPPYPQVEKRGKIINEIPAGTCNPAYSKTKDGGHNGTDVGGRPSEVDHDVTTNSWNREQRVNQHMSKDDKEGRDRGKKEGVA